MNKLEKVAVLLNAGLDRRDIALECDISRSTVNVYAYQARKRGLLRSNQLRTQIFIWLSQPIHRKLLDEALSRNLSTDNLISQILTNVVGSNLFKAVLDD